MPAATRERGLEAAVELLGAEGVRALTHARVDERAGLPPGSTSNWFRTRRALLGGIVDWIAERERADLEPAAMPTISGVDQLSRLCTVVELRTEGSLRAPAGATPSSWSSRTTLSSARRCGGGDESSRAVSGAVGFVRWPVRHPRARAGDEGACGFWHSATGCFCTG